MTNDSCPHCLEIMKSLVETVRTYQGRGYNITASLTLNCHDPDCSPPTPPTPTPLPPTTGGGHHLHSPEPTGMVCSDCGSSDLTPAGACLKCNNCGSSTGCG